MEDVQKPNNNISSGIIENNWLKSPGLWNGAHSGPVAESELKMLYAAGRNAGRDLTFAEKKTLLLRLRADMPTLSPPKTF